MASTEPSIADLQQRLVTFTTQLESIHGLLQSNGGENVELRTIAKDLVEVIRLTKDTIELKRSAAAASFTEDKEDKTTQGQHVAGHEDVQSETVESSLSKALSLEPGTVCEAESKGVWYPAYIDSVTSTGVYQVTYLGFGNKDELPASAFRAIVRPERAVELPEKAEIAVGFRCQVKYYVDMQIYVATVTEVTPRGFRVLFDGYGNSEEVPYEYLQPLDDAAATATSGTTAAAIGTAPETESIATTTAAAAPVDTELAKIIKVPENLQILPTDTEAEKKRKHKRLKQIQKLNKQAEAENERKVKQQNWKSFQNKAIHKRVRGTTGVLARHGGSIFASPATVEGRVGVVGSGQGMTAFEDTRKKAKRTHLENAPPLL